MNCAFLIFLVVVVVGAQGRSFSLSDNEIADGPDTASPHKASAKAYNKKLFTPTMDMLEKLKFFSQYYESLNPPHVPRGDSYMNVPSSNLFAEELSPPAVDPTSYFSYEISNVSDTMPPPRSAESSYLVFDPSATLDATASPSEASGYVSFSNAPIYALEVPDVSNKQSSSYSSFSSDQSAAMKMSAPDHIEDDIQSFKSAALSSQPDGLVTVERSVRSDKAPTLHGLLTPLAHVLGSFAGELNDEPRHSISSGFRWK